MLANKGSGGRNRTDVAWSMSPGWETNTSPRTEMVERAGFQPATSRVQAECSRN